MPVPTLDDRASGVLLHPTSLPGPHGNGDLGEQARRFVDFLAASGQRWWQMLPVAPPGYGNSPYSAQSAFAGSPLLISLSALAAEGLLTADDLAPGERLPRTRVDYGAAWEHRDRCLRKAWRTFVERGKGRDELDAFLEAHRDWLPDFALFRALKRAHGEVEWTRWADELRQREPKALERARRDLADEVDFEVFCQWQFARQWAALRAYAAERGVGLIGDIPIFVAHDSADVWQHRELFRLDDRGMPTHVAGVPPDYFSVTGQRWGNPLYRWRVLAKTGYAWWIARLRQMLDRFDAIRLDHFIGFQRYWEIPASCPIATEGRWVKGPGADFFDAVRAALGRLPLIAEDLGAVTPSVKRLRDRFALPGIRVLQFAFGNDPSAPDFKPHNYRRRCVAYTGTHDNDTIVGWFHERGGGERSPEQIERERRAALRYLGTEGKEIHWEMIRVLHMSVARLAMVPMQDLLGLGAEARMNRPGTDRGNWEWRLDEGALTPELERRLADLTRTYGRHPDQESAR